MISFVKRRSRTNEFIKSKRDMLDESVDKINGNISKENGILTSTNFNQTRSLKPPNCNFS